MADVAVLPADPASAFKRAQQGKSYWRRVWERLRDDKVTLAVIGVLVMLLVMVVFAPWFTVHDPYTGSVLRRLKPVGTPGHWLGTDEVGRDLWARMVFGGRLSLLAGGSAGVPGAADRWVPRRRRRLRRRARQQRHHASDRRTLRLSVDPAGDSHHWHPRLRPAKHHSGTDDQLHPADHPHLGERHDAGAAPGLR